MTRQSYQATFENLAQFVAAPGIIFPMDIKAGVQTAIVMVILGVLLTLWGGIQSIRSGRKLSYFRLRQARMARGWWLIILAFLLVGGAFWLGSYGESTAYEYYHP